MLEILTWPFVAVPVLPIPNVTEFAFTSTRVPDVICLPLSVRTPVLSDAYVIFTDTIVTPSVAEIVNVAFPV